MTIESVSEENIGFKIHNNKLEFIFPKFINPDYFDKDLRESELFEFYNLFKKYIKDSNKQRSIKEKDNFRILTQNISMTNDFSLIETYFSLLEDFKENGLVLFSELNKSIKPKGKINWTKTINNNDFIINNENLIYNKLFFNNLTLNKNHPITVLHIIAIMVVSEKLSLKINLKYDYKILNQLIKSIQFIESTIKKYKRDMFSDRHKKVLKLLENLFLKNRLEDSLSKKGDKLFYVEKFDWIWEKMLKEALFDESSKFNESIPNGKYDINNIKSYGLIPKLDLIVTNKYDDKDYLLVIDAKNYIPENNLPKTPDITKQINYKLFLSNEFYNNNEYKLENIINVFIMPSSSGEGIKYIGKHQFIENFKHNPLGLILCFQINFFDLRKNYLKTNRIYKEKIINFITQTYIGEIKEYKTEAYNL